MLTQRGEEVVVTSTLAGGAPTKEPLDGSVRTTARLDGGGVDRATVVCGFLGCDARPFNPLLAALPRMLHMPGAAEKSSWIKHFISVAVDEANLKRPGGEAVLERLSEMMFVDVVRRYLENLPPEQTGWLAGLRDRLGRPSAC